MWQRIRNGLVSGIVLGIALVLVGSLRALRLNRTLAATLSLTVALGTFLWLLLGSGLPRGV